MWKTVKSRDILSQWQWPAPGGEGFSKQEAPAPFHGTAALHSRKLCFTCYRNLSGQIQFACKCCFLGQNLPIFKCWHQLNNKNLFELNSIWGLKSFSKPTIYNLWCELREHRAPKTRYSEMTLLKEDSLLTKHLIRKWGGEKEMQLIAGA